MARQQISEAHYTAVGRVTTLFGLLEFIISTLIWILMRTEQTVARAVTAKLSFSAQLDLLSVLARHRFDDVKAIAEVDALIRKTSQIEQRRNQIAHSIWTVAKDTPEVTRIKFVTRRFKELRTQAESTTVADLNALTQAIQDIVREMINLVGQIEYIPEQAGDLTEKS